jgi:hypothetical protein
MCGRRTPARVQRYLVLGARRRWRICTGCSVVAQSRWAASWAVNGSDPRPSDRRNIAVMLTMYKK